MYKIILSFRYLIKRRISYLAFLAVTLCVFIVVVVMTVIAGLVRDFKDNNHKWVGDCIVGTESLVGFPYYEDFIKRIEGADFIEGVSAVVKSYALVKNRDLEESSGVEIMGIDPVKHSRVTNFGETLYHRKNDAAKAFEPVYNPNLTGCVVGIGRWLVRDDKGKYSYETHPSEAALLVSCFPLTAKGALAKAGTDLVNTKTFYYSDTSHSGLVWVDSSYIYLPFEEAQLLCGMAGAVKRVSAIHIKFNVEEVCRGKKRRRTSRITGYSYGAKLEGIQEGVYCSDGERADNADDYVCSCGGYNCICCLCCFLYDCQP
jgi:hypothetical protein